MQSPLVRFVRSFSFGLALTACAAAQPTGPAAPDDRSATAPRDPALPTANRSPSKDPPSNAGESAPEEGSGIVTSRTTSIVVRVRSGGPPPVPPEIDPAWRDCAYNALYTLNLKTHELTWDFCVSHARGTRVLASNEVAGLDQALARLKVVKDGGLCPIHAPTVSLTTTGDVMREYHVADLCGGVPPWVGADATQGLVDVLLKATGH